MCSYCMQRAGVPGPAGELLATAAAEAGVGCKETVKKGPKDLKALACCRAASTLVSSRWGRRDKSEGGQGGTTTKKYRGAELFGAERAESTSGSRSPREGRGRGVH